MRRLGVTVSDPVVEAVLDPSARLALQVPVRWKDRPGTARAEMAVSNVRALPLLVGMQVTKAKPWKPTVYLMLENEQLRRLDINGSHTNRTPPRERWVHRTHKHMWSEAHHDAVAYRPSDIPAVALGDMTGEHLREIFEGFLAECHIEPRGAYRWSDPTLTSSTTGRLGVS
jgi:hypothetical protein